MASLQTQGKTSRGVRYTIRNNMKSSRRLVAVIFLGASGLPLMSDARQHDAAAVIAKYDTNHNHGLDLAEALAAASKHFDALNRDRDTTLEMAEVRGIVGPRMFAQADVDHDGSLSKDEFLALVARLFRKADTEHFGCLYPRDLQGKAAHALLELIE